MEGVGRTISLDEANAFLELTQRTARRIAAGVFLCICSPICLILLGGFAEYGQIPMTENMAGGLGTAILLLMIAAGVVSFILNGMQLSKYEYLEKEPLFLLYGVQGVVSMRKEAYAPIFRRNIAFGVALCILGIVPILLAAAFSAGDLVYVCCVALLLFLIACGVYCMASSGAVYASFEKLLQEGDYTTEKKEIGKKLNFVPGVYWCAVTALFLGVSFFFDNWDRSWIIWPVAAVLFAALYGILSAVVKARKK